MGLMAMPNATAGSTSSGTSSLGTMLFAGNYTPTINEANKPMYQNFVSNHCNSRITTPTLTLVFQIDLNGTRCPTSREHNAECRAFLCRRRRVAADIGDREYECDDHKLGLRLEVPFLVGSCHTSWTIAVDLNARGSNPVRELERLYDVIA